MVDQVIPSLILQSSAFNVTGGLTVNNVNVTVGTTVPVGMWSPSMNTLALNTNSSQVVTILSTGQMIVGNSTGGTFLTAALVVTSSGSQPQIQTAYNSGTNGFIVQQTSTAGGVKLYNGDNSELTLGTNNTERMRITALGNVGIGTATVTAGNAVSVFGGNIQVGSTGNGIKFADGTYQSTAPVTAQVGQGFVTQYSGPSTAPTFQSQGFGII